MAQPLKSEKEGEKTLSLQEIIVKVTNMVSWDSKAQRMAKNSGLNINYVSWEDCARNMGSSWGMSPRSSFTILPNPWIQYQSIYPQNNTSIIHKNTKHHISLRSMHIRYDITSKSIMYASNA